MQSTADPRRHCVGFAALRGDSEGLNSGAVDHTDARRGQGEVYAGDAHGRFTRWRSAVRAQQRPTAGRTAVVSSRCSVWVVLGLAGPIVGLSTPYRLEQQRVRGRYGRLLFGVECRSSDTPTNQLVKSLTRCCYDGLIRQLGGGLRL